MSSVFFFFFTIEAVCTPNYQLHKAMAQAMDHGFEEVKPEPQATPSPATASELGLRGWPQRAWLGLACSFQAGPAHHYSQGRQQSNEWATVLPGVESNLLQKACPKPKPITKQPRCQGPTSLIEKSSLPPKAHPKPKPIAKRPQHQLPTSAEEQHDIEDGLFIQKLTRPQVEKVREAPPAQLRLEKDALKQKGHQND